MQCIIIIKEGKLSRNFELTQTKKSKTLANGTVTRAKFQPKEDNTVIPNFSKVYVDVTEFKGKSKTAKKTAKGKK